ncbi:MAG: hypothetical protein WC640_00290 [Candidatus Paceibacterota bacterium]|jgi:hypothetical protein
MSIKEMTEKVKFYSSWWRAREKELFVALLVVLVALLSFGLGRLSKIEGCQQPVQIENALQTQ